MSVVPTSDAELMYTFLHLQPPFPTSPLCLLPYQTRLYLTQAVPEEMQQKAVDATSSALERYNVEKDVAMYIKKEFDRLYGTTWHCVVGKKWVLFRSLHSYRG